MNAAGIAQVHANLEGMRRRLARIGLTNVTTGVDEDGLSTCQYEFKPVVRTVRVGGEWMAINGVHVFVGKGGTIENGPTGLIGKKPDELELKPNAHNPDQVHNPIARVTDKEKIDFDAASSMWIKEHEELGDNVDEMLNSGKGLPLETIDPNNCIATQEFVHKDVVQHDDRSPMVLAELQSKYLVKDGNHRVAAALLNGRTFKAYVQHLG